MVIAGPAISGKAQVEFCIPAVPWIGLTAVPWIDCRALNWLLAWLI